MASASEEPAHDLFRPLSLGLPRPSESDALLVEALRKGDSTTFSPYYRRWYLLMRSIAMTYVADQVIAEDLIQETWLAAIAGVDGFQFRSSFKTWLLSILTRQAKKRAAKENRAAAVIASCEVSEDGDKLWCFDENGSWASPVPVWHETPEECLLIKEARDELERALSSLPPRQEAIFRLRYIEGWTAREACELLGITKESQRMLLHRARQKLQQAYSARVRSGSHGSLGEKPNQ